MSTADDTDDTDDMETWLLEAGDAIIEKRAAQGEASLSPSEHAIYCMWALDYAVRNAGSLDALEDVHETAIAELADFARAHKIDMLSTLLDMTADEDEEAFVDAYYEQFDTACTELRRLNETRH
ncbi:hypothetical protein [Variovorax sp. W2I14]|uniref:hypothetical protein n=1 Tax=Variovorax sp. W2I14 TaxID=3042290 RepID=UPI003D194FA0